MQIDGGKNIQKEKTKWKCFGVAIYLACEGSKEASEAEIEKAMAEQQEMRWEWQSGLISHGMDFGKPLESWLRGSDIDWLVLGQRSKQGLRPGLPGLPLQLASGFPKKGVMADLG